ncbi:MAG TPA: hypothetical protein O0X88_02695 [Methanocorpusculum sp.]|nr:hypothetical protein [Methanocorpusculum sp.]
MTRNPDDIMAEHLLTGGKMLSEACPKCGAPLFEIHGVKQCVVCAENAKEEPVVPAVKKETAEPKADEVRVIMPAYAKEETLPSTPLGDEIDSLIHVFIQRAHAEPDASRCLTYMECIRTAAEAKTMLVRHR